MVITARKFEISLILIILCLSTTRRSEQKPSHEHRHSGRACWKCTGFKGLGLINKKIRFLSFSIFFEILPNFSPAKTIFIRFHTENSCIMINMSMEIYKSWYNQTSRTIYILGWLICFQPDVTQLKFLWFCIENKSIFQKHCFKRIEFWGVVFVWNFNAYIYFRKTQMIR